VRTARRPLDMSTKAKQAKQKADASWTAPTSVLYDRVLSPFYDEVARLLWPAWLHPNYITLLGGIFCTLSVLAMQRGDWGWACATFPCYHACDNTDGKHARRTGKSSKFGHVLDHAVDATAGVTAITLIFEQVLFGCVAHSYMNITMAVFLTCHLAEFTTGRPMLGFRWLSVDEVNLLCSAALAWRAVRAGGEAAPLPVGLHAAACDAGDYILPALQLLYAVVSLFHAPRAFAVFAAFSLGCWVLSPFWTIALYVALMGGLLLKNAKLL